jgi:hypothetical protein
MITFKCLIGFHKYYPIDEPEITGVEEDIIHFDFKHQCLRCGKIKTKKYDRERKLPSQTSKTVRKDS